MPVDNVHGMRTDTLALLKQLNGTVYRALGTGDDLDHEGVDQRVLRALASGPRTIQALQEELGLSNKVVGGALDQLS